MVACERCHRRFGSYAAVLEHHKTKHPNVANLTELQVNVALERETQLIYETNTRHSTHGSSRLKYPET